MAENKGGRPRRELTDDERAQVEALAQYLTQDQIADYLGVTRKTFAAIVERDEDVSTRYKRGKAKAIAAISQSLMGKARKGDTASMIFFLKTQAGWRETTRLEHTNPDGDMKQVVVFELPDNGRDPIEAAGDADGDD